MRILYVENHETFARIVIQEFLHSYEVFVAPGLEQARALLHTSRFDLALVDYDLDDGKGDELVRELKACYPDIPAIAASSHDMGNAALTAAGAVAICAKTSFAGIRTIIEGVMAEGMRGQVNPV